MNRTCLILCAALALSACGKDKPAEGNQAFSDEDFTESAIVANDVTAIDAATGDAANMAADVPPDTSFDEGDGGAGDNNASAPSRGEARNRRTSRETLSGTDNAAAPSSAPATPAPATAAPAATSNSVG